MFTKSRILTALALWLICVTASHAQDFDYPAAFSRRQIETNGASIYVRVSGQGSPVVLLHGYGETGDMWIPMALNMVRDHTVIVPDLRGLGLSSKPAGGFDKKTQAGDLAGVLDALKIDRIDLVAHDIGNMVAFAFAAQYPERVRRLVVIDAPIPGVGPWEEILKNPLLWHFRFGGPDMERLVAGRERILLDRFYNELSATPASIDEETRDHYAALYARPGAIHDSFSGQFAAFAQDAIDNQALVGKGKLTLPVLAIGGDHSYSGQLATEVGFAAANVRSAVIGNSGHWIMEEQPQQAVAVIVAFLEDKE